MNDDYEVIEVGDNGEFDVSHKAVPLARKEEAKALDYSNFDWSASIRDDNIDLLQSLKPSEFVVYESPTKVLWVIARLPEGHDEGEVRVQRKGDILQIQHNGDGFDVSLPNGTSLESKTLNARVYQSFITVQIE